MLLSIWLLVKGKPLTHDQQRLLFSNPTLRADFQRLKRDFELTETGDASEDESAGASIVRFPLAAAAASAGEDEIDEREFGGIELRSARSGDQMLIQIANYDPSNPPNRLQVQGARGETSRVVLPPPPLAEVRPRLSGSCCARLKTSEKSNPLKSMFGWRVPEPPFAGLDAGKTFSE